MSKGAIIWQWDDRLAQLDLHTYFHYKAGRTVYDTEYSLLCFCVACGKVWATAKAFAADGRQFQYRPHPSACSEPCLAGQLRSLQAHPRRLALGLPARILPTSLLAEHFLYEMELSQ